MQKSTAPPAYAYPDPSAPQPPLGYPSPATSVPPAYDYPSTSPPQPPLGYPSPATSVPPAYDYPSTSPPQPPLGYPSPATSVPPEYAYPPTSAPQPPLAYASPATSVPPMMYANPSPSVPPPMPYANPATAIISPQFCSTYPVDLGIVRKVLTITDGNFVVTDVNGNTVFKVKGHLSLHERRTLLDAAGYPIVTLRKKLLSAHERWQVFRGESTELSNLVFSVKQSSMIQLKTKLDVFLGNNTRDHAPDFRVKGSWLERSCVIYAGNSSTIVAQMHKKHTVKSVLFGKDNFMVTVYPGIDYAFIVALIVILDEINASD